MSATSILALYWKVSEEAFKQNSQRINKLIESSAASIGDRLGWCGFLDCLQEVFIQNIRQWMTAVMNVQLIA